MIGIAVFFIIIGVLIKYGKMYSLIAGYNTMPAEKRARYDIEGIAKLIGNTFFGMALIIIIGYCAAEFFENPEITDLAFFGSLLIGIPYILVLSNSDKYKMDEEKG